MKDYYSAKLENQPENSTDAGLSGMPGGTENKEEDNISRAKRKAMNSIAMIYGFRNALPLKKILKYMYKNHDYQSGTISGGEEWFSIYKKLLKEEIDNSTDVFIFKLKKKGILARLRSYISDMPAADRDYIMMRYKDDHLPLKKCNLLYLLNIFYEKYYVEKIEKTVARIMLDGIFYKDSNRKELNEAFNLINTFKNEYAGFIEKLKPASDNQKNAPPLNIDDIASGKKKKKSDNLIKYYNTEGYKIYKNYIEVFIAIKNILGGISNGNAQGKYDTLSNLSILCEEKTSMSVQSIDKLYRTLSDILNVLNEYDEIDRIQYD